MPSRISNESNLEQPEQAILILSNIFEVLWHYTETGTLPKDNVDCLQAFCFMRIMRHILWIHWLDNDCGGEGQHMPRGHRAEDQTKETCPLGHVTRIQPGVPAHDALWSAL